MSLPNPINEMLKQQKNPSNREMVDLNFFHVLRGKWRLRERWREREGKEERREKRERMGGGREEEMKEET